jgi:predicted MFS family arabinose efflux permease
MAGIRYVRADAMIGLLVLLAAVPAILVLNLFTFFPVYARDILAIGPEGLGLLLSAVGIGALVGAGSYAVMLPGGGSARLMMGGLGLVGVTLSIFGLSRSLPVSLVALVIYGAAQVGFYSTVQALIQTRAAQQMRGRVMSLYLFMALGLMPVGNVLSGLVAERFGVQVALGGGGLVTIAAVLATWVRSPRLRALGTDREAEQP